MRPDAGSVPVFYHDYVRLVPEDTVTDALQHGLETVKALLTALPEEKWAYRYAAGKWSIREIVQHITDSERIFSYRALCIARRESMPLPGFDEKAYADEAAADLRSSGSLTEEFIVVRQATIILFRSFPETWLNRKGIANNSLISVNGIGFVAAGHALHHCRIIRERYLQ